MPQILQGRIVHSAMSGIAPVSDRWFLTLNGPGKNSGGGESCIRHKGGSQALDVIALAKGLIAQTYERHILTRLNYPALGVSARRRFIKVAKAFTPVRVLAARTCDCSGLRN